MKSVVEQKIRYQYRLFSLTGNEKFKCSLCLLFKLEAMKTILVYKTLFNSKPALNANLKMSVANKFLTLITIEDAAFDRKFINKNLNSNQKTSCINKDIRL